MDTLLYTVLTCQPLFAPPLDCELLKARTALPVLLSPPSLCFSMVHGEGVPFM